MAGRYIYNEDRVKLEPLDEAPPSIEPKPADRSVVKLLERVRQVEKERDAANTQLLTFIGKYTDAEQRNAWLETQSRQALEAASRRISELESAESGKVIEWINKYKEELAKNHANEKRSSKGSDEVDSLRRELEAVKNQLDNERNTKCGIDQNSKAILKSNMELSSQVAKLKKANAQFEADIRVMLVDMQKYQHCLADAKAVAAVAEDRTVQAEGEMKQLLGMIQHAEQLRTNALAESSDLRTRLHEMMKVVDQGKMMVEEASAFRAEATEYKARLELLKETIKQADAAKKSAVAEAVECRSKFVKLKTEHDEADQQRKSALAEATVARTAHEKLKEEHEEMRTINGFLATTASGKIFADLTTANKRIDFLEKRIGTSRAAAEPLAKKRKTGEI